MKYKFLLSLCHSDVKVARFGDLIDARTVSCSSIVPLVHPHGLMVSKGTLLLIFYSYVWSLHISEFIEFLH